MTTSPSRAKGILRMPTTAYPSPSTSHQVPSPSFSSRLGERSNDPFTTTVYKSPPRGTGDDWRNIPPITGTTPRYVPSPPATSPPTPPTLGSDASRNAIEFACKMTEDLLMRDLNYPSLFRQIFGTEETGFRTVSGLLDHDYPNVIEKGLIPNKLWGIEHQAPLPTDLETIALQADPGTVKMGLFPEIGRAWMTIDSDFYLWDFRDGSDLAYYDGLRETIVGFALVPVKPNVFKSSIRHLLCVSTASDIYLLGFILVESTGFRSGSPSPIKTAIEIVSHPIFTVSTESLSFPVITASPNGRIFLGGQDGSVHEVWYQSGRGWLRDRCGKTNLTWSFLSSLWPKFLSISSPDAVMDIVIDKFRNILFTIAVSGCIQAYDLGSDGTSFSNVGYMTFEVIINSVISISKRSLDATCVRNIVSIAPIDYGEMNLVAVTDSGTRLYFTCFERPHQIGVRIGARPTTLQLVHVRLPPGFSPMTSVKKPDSAHRGFYAKGVFSLACTSTRDKDLLWLISPFLYPSPRYAEMSNVHILPGVLHDLKEITYEVDPGTLEFPDILTQHLPWQRQIVVLSSWGTTVFRCHKPFELLRDLLVEKQGPENVKAHFFMLPTRELPLTNALLIAVNPFPFTDNNLFDWATKSLFLYGESEQLSEISIDGRNPRVAFDLRQSGTGVESPEFSSTPQRGFPQGGSSSYNLGAGSPTLHSTFRDQPLTPTSPSSPFPPSQQPSPSPQPYYDAFMSDFTYSPRHNAIYLTVGRILLPFWHRKIVSTSIVRTPGARQTKMIIPNITGDEVAYALKFLDSIYKFLERNPSLYTNTARPKVSTSPDLRHNASFEAEKVSLSHLKGFLSLTLEVLGMWQILCDHQFHIVLEGVDERLYNSTMKELIVGGHGVVAIIINALINKYLGDNTAVDSISLRLREVCPTLFRSEDAIGSKVAEILARAKSTSDPLEKENLLKDSLVLSEQLCGQGRFDIKSFCQQFASLGYPLGAVRLCTSAARGADPDKIALGRFKSTSDSPDPAATNAYARRCAYYKIIFGILDTFLTQSTLKQSPLAARKLDDRISPDKARQLVDETIRAILSTDDEVFHITLYNWLMDRKMFDRLLEIRHEYLDNFLKRAADSVVSGKWPTAEEASGKGDTRVLDLLWRHHEMNSNHQAAAQILSKLADMTTTGLNLEQRLEYLSRAVICAKSMGRQGDVLEIYEDKLEVAQIQKLILDSLQHRLGALAIEPVSSEAGVAESKLLQDATMKLNSQLFNITDLFANFSHPFKLYEANLEILHSAGHSDEALIEQLWSDIIDSELSVGRHQPKETQMEILKRKLLTLGRKYIAAPTYFPLEYLIHHLEILKPRDIDKGWVFQTMLDIGVPFYELILYYEKLWKRGLQTESAGIDVLFTEVVIQMVSSFVHGNIDLGIRSMQRMELIEKCTDFVSAMIVEYSSRFDPASTEITQKLNAVKDRLDNHR